MNKTIALVVTTALSLIAVSAQADTIPNAKAAELNLHRIERLVILKKIDAAYETNFKGLVLADETPTKPGDPSFKVTSSEVAGADGTAHTLDVFLDNTGKEVSHQVNVGADSVGAPTWPNADAITLAEDSMHWLEDQGPTVAELTPYLNGLTALSLSPGKLADGTQVAWVDIETTPTDPVLHVVLNLDGTFNSYQLNHR